MVKFLHLSALVVCASFAPASCQIPCDSEYGEYCPEMSSYAVGTCIREKAGSGLSAQCAEYLDVMNACQADIDTFCNGLEFTGEVMGCLTQWTKPADLSAACAAALPEPPAAKKPREKSEEEKKKAARRRRVRDKAAKMARDQHPQNPDRKNKGEKKKKKKKKG
eukprot:CAMPEP_0182465516 /NCGR_PEP_ID=MMETSP1319-20130603/9925_1 /TAXON_ID=172717 /ORGANISM="Bolidomonas pacifica, Strain RCC208" /LENGTH=163 /DNA_ID=CAMNT_0024665289 /DNA_START=72 /DNA_END=560 /DNA_ORIENTATION=-